MGRLPMESQSQFQYPQPQAAYHPYPPPSQQHQAAVVYPQPQNSVNVVQAPPYHTTSPMSPMPQSHPNVVPTNGSLQGGLSVGTPVQHRPMPLRLTKPVHNVPWTTGLFDCMDDPTNALITAVFPCVTFGQIADVLDNGNTTCATSGIVYAFAPCVVSGPYRKKLRQRFGLVEAPASDRVIHSVLEHCALCQEYRELNNRGINPALGIFFFFLQTNST
ncbi:protein PLANT CADMIUM RESISTANCE 4-like [Hibiscus syriacus]|uniref:protein PLANT CADMIUM RESISTANCE 4-like n=1 Tax=Hibiscus syriacus TaxID=106335 RepID=UPI0019210E72|nr:protein PLANT CADMIUM RESISTANCE 4-like [Hibiscus syriacus]